MVSYEPRMPAGRLDAPAVDQPLKAASVLDTIKAGTAPTVLDDWQLSVPQAVPCGVQAAEPGEQARACGGTHLRLARNAPLLQSQDILGALLREVNSAEDSLLTARSGTGTARSARPNLARITPLSRFAANRVLPDPPADSLRQPLQQQLEESRREAASLREQLEHCQVELERATARRSGARRFGCFGF